jgi:trypsin
VQIFLLVALAAVAISSPFPEAFFECEARIVGGLNAVLGQFPYQVSLRTAANSHFCGGSIINKRWVLSAAHCNSVHIAVGTVLLDSDGVVHVSSRIIVHRNYNPQTIANDVSVVQTATVITFNANVQPVVLGSEFIDGEVDAVVTGWESTDDKGGPHANNLQHLQTSTFTRIGCLQRHAMNLHPMIFEHKVCADTKSG